MKQCRLRRPTRLRVAAGRILPILNDIEIKAAELAATKIVHPVINVVKLIVLVGRLNLYLQRLRFTEDPSIERQEGIARQHIP